MFYQLLIKLIYLGMILSIEGKLSCVKKFLELRFDFKLFY